MTLRFLDISLLINAINKQMEVTGKQFILGVTALVQYFASGIEKNRQCHQLQQLSDERLKDLGITREQADKEKLFWH